MNPASPFQTVPASGLLLQFLHDLRAGRPLVIHLAEPGSWQDILRTALAEAEADLRVRDLLRAWHAEALGDLGGAPVDFHEPAGRNGAGLLFQAVWYYLHRDAGAQEVAGLTARELEGFPDPAAQFSADLTLQYLPEVFRMARALAPSDPLLAALRELAGQVPLSSPGMPRDEDVEVVYVSEAAAALREHPGLWQLFLDRIVQRKDHPWMGHREVAGALRRSMGAYVTELAPGLMPGQDFPSSHL